MLLSNKTTQDNYYQTKRKVEHDSIQICSALVPTKKEYSCTSSSNSTTANHTICCFNNEKSRKIDNNDDICISHTTNDNNLWLLEQTPFKSINSRRTVTKVNKHQTQRNNNNNKTTIITTNHAEFGSDDGQIYILDWISLEYIKF